MQRPMVAMARSGDLAAWLQYDEFSPQFDLFDFRANTGTTSTIDLHTTWFGGLAWGVSKRLRLSYQYSTSRQESSRQVEPRALHTRYTGHELRAQYTLWQRYPLMATIEAGYRAHTSGTEAFHAYFVGTTTQLSYVSINNLRYDGKTGNISTTDGSPLATFQTKDRAWLVAGRLLYEPADNLNIAFGLELRRLTVEASFLVPALNTPGVLALVQGFSKFQSFQQDIPQSTPWHETHILLQAALNWQPWDRLTLGADLTHYQIQRSGYIPSPKRPVQYNTADQLDGYIFWRAFKHLTLYGHGRASTRYLLGDLPLAYNSRSNHRFGNPYGFLSAGGVLSF
ncbi:MAG: hypothetical protein D6682_01570 [Zetaproteobacteria bacterium]|nr:MAG: hypothetical protein D6682_01570 [Zetaproteobacteria bacterium]